MWDTLTGQELLALKGHTHYIYCVAFSPDGKRLASGSRDSLVKVWDATSGEELFTLKGHDGNVLGVAFSPDGKRLASSSNDQTVKLWDTQSGQETLTLKGQGGQRAGGVVFSTDGKRLALPKGDMVEIWDAQPRSPEGAPVAKTQCGFKRLRSCSENTEQRRPISTRWQLKPRRVLADRLDDPSRNA